MVDHIVSDLTQEWFISLGFAILSTTTMCGSIQQWFMSLSLVVILSTTTVWQRSSSCCDWSYWGRLLFEVWHRVHVVIGHNDDNYGLMFWQGSSSCCNWSYWGQLLFEVSHRVHVVIGHIDDNYCLRFDTGFMLWLVILTTNTVWGLTEEKFMSLWLVISSTTTSWSLTKHWCMLWFVTLSTTTVWVLTKERLVLLLLVLLSTNCCLMFDCRVICVVSNSCVVDFYLTLSHLMWNLKFYVVRTLVHEENQRRVVN